MLVYFMAEDSKRDRKKPQKNNDLTQIDPNTFSNKRSRSHQSGQVDGELGKKLAHQKSVRPATKPLDKDPAQTSQFLKGADSTRGKAMDANDRTRIMQARSPANEPASKPTQKPGAETPTQVNKKSPAQLTNYKAAPNTVLKKRFVLEQVVGVGGMGVVYKAKDLRKVEAKDRNPYLAVKILNDEFRKHPDAFIALQREARKSQSIAHPNIVNVHDFDRDGDIVFMTMEFMEGVPLDKLLRDRFGRGLSFEHAMEIFKGMCAALQHAHAENIVHADFKPGNVFVSKNGVTKVFDFGIARAVAQVDKNLLHNDNTLFNPAEFANDASAKVQHDKSVFDPDTLGALTPAYASVEMLRGETPNMQDDVFALGIVTYELLAGYHPYKRMNAEQAMLKNVTPKRIKSISRQQWNALKKALAFNREDRTSSVYEFLWDFTHAKESPIKKWIATAAVLVVGVAIGIGAYTNYIYEKPLSPEELKAQLEQQIKIDLVKKSITSLLADISFSELWQEDIWREIQSARELLGMENQWLQDTEAKILNHYLNRTKSKRKENHLTEAQTLLTRAERYRGDAAALEQEQFALKIAFEQYNAAQERLAKDRKLKEQERAKRLAEQKKRDAQKRAKQKAVKKVEVKEPPKDVFALALNNVKQQLRCKGDLNTTNFKAAVQKLKSIDAKRYKSEESRIVGALASCIERIGQNNSNRALDIKKFALTLFPGNRVLANLKISPKDPCGNMLAGLGARGKSGTCRDRFYEGGYGPRMVVIPGAQGMRTFAIGQFEVSVGELNEFCSTTKICKPVNNISSELPATNVSYKTVKAYVRWLSRNTGYTYRIPRQKEWLFAAKAKNSALDDNRNCSIKSRGINKGEQLENVNAGKKNKWGLVNHVGNAQEWVLVNNRDLVAIGGAHIDSIQRCQYESQRDHNGEADSITGFRVLRELRKS